MDQETSTDGQQIPNYLIDPEDDRLTCPLSWDMRSSTTAFLFNKSTANFNLLRQDTFTA